jgi:hypothetical protein
MNETDVLQQIQDIDLSKVPTAYPILASGVVQATIVEFGFDQRENRKGETNNWAVVKYTLAQPWKTQPLDDTPSQEIAVGFPFTERILIKPWTDPKTGKETLLGLQRLALLREAVFGKAAEGTKFNGLELVGQSITLRLKFDPAPKNRETGEVYGPRTEVDGYVRAKR